MLKQLFNYKEEPKYNDTTDGLAVAVCHFFQSRTLGVSSDKKYSGWESYVSQNPQKIK